MNKEEKRNEIKRLLKKCPEILTPAKVAKWSPLGRNRVYELLKKGDLRSFKYQGGYIIGKEVLIDYLTEHCDDDAGRTFKRGDDND